MERVLVPSFLFSHGAGAGAPNRLLWRVLERRAVERGACAVLLSVVMVGCSGKIRVSSSRQNRCGSRFSM